MIKKRTTHLSGFISVVFLIMVKGLIDHNLPWRHVSYSSSQLTRVLNQRHDRSSVICKVVHHNKKVLHLDTTRNSILSSSRKDSVAEESSLPQVNSVPDTKNDYISLLLLNGVALLWGSQHVVIKTAIETFPTTSLVNFWRFFVSAALFSPALLFLLKEDRDDQFKLPTIKAGIELGIYTFLGFAFQAIGLETTTASRSAFLLYLNVKFVPFLAYLLLGRSISASTLTSALLAFSGTVLLSSDALNPLNLGDFWCLCAALASAMFILRLEKFSNLFNAAALNSVSFVTVALLCGLWVLGDLFSLSSTGADGPYKFAQDIGAVLNSGPLDKFSTSFQPQQIWSSLVENPLPIIYLGAISTGLCNYLQTVGQRTISAERSAVVYSMDPVYGAIFSNIFLHEQLGPYGLIGAGLVVLGVIISARATATITSTTTTSTSDTDIVATKES